MPRAKVKKPKIGDPVRFKLGRQIHTGVVYRVFGSPNKPPFDIDVIDDEHEHCYAVLIPSQCKIVPMKEVLRDYLRL